MSTVMKDMNEDDKQVSTADLAQQLTTLRDEFGGFTQTIKDLAATSRDDAILAAQIHMSDAGHIVADRVETARLQGMVMQDRATDLVRNQPMVAVGLAAGVGILLGVIANRR